MFFLLYLVMHSFDTPMFVQFMIHILWCYSVMKDKYPDINICALRVWKGYSCSCFNKNVNTWSVTGTCCSIFKMSKVWIFAWRPAFLRYFGDFPLPLYTNKYTTATSSTPSLIVHAVFLTEQHTMNAYWGSGGIAPHILDLSTRWRWVVIFTSCSFTPREGPWYPLDTRMGGPPPQKKILLICK